MTFDGGANPGEECRVEVAQDGFCICKICLAKSKCDVSRSVISC